MERSNFAVDCLNGVVFRHPGNSSRLLEIRLNPARTRPLIHRPTWETSDESDELPSLPRKEVIQPHLPVQLPCYDFVPVTDPTLGVCPPEGLAQRLQVLPTSMT
jgi:hypothetical protein